MANRISTIPGINEYITVINAILDLGEAGLNSNENFCDKNNVEFGQIKRVKGKDGNPLSNGDVRTDITINNDSTCGAHIDLVHTESNSYVIMYAPFNNSCANNLANDNPEIPSDLPVEIQQGIKNKKCRLATYSDDVGLNMNFRTWLRVAVIPSKPSVLSLVNAIINDKDVLANLSLVTPFNANELAKHGNDYSVFIHDLTGKSSGDINVSDRIDSKNRWVSTPFSKDSTESFILYVKTADTTIPLYKFTISDEHVYAERFDGNKLDKSITFSIPTSSSNTFSFDDSLKSAIEKSVSKITNTPLNTLSNDSHALISSEYKYAAHPIFAINHEEFDKIYREEMNLLHEAKVNLAGSEDFDEDDESYIDSLIERIKKRLVSNAVIADDQTTGSNILIDNCNILYHSDFVWNDNVKVVISTSPESYSNDKSQHGTSANIYTYNSSITIFAYNGKVATIYVSSDPSKSSKNALWLNSAQNVKLKWYQSGTSNGVAVVNFDSALSIVSRLLALHAAAKDIQNSAKNAIVKQSEYSKSDINNLHCECTFGVDNGQYANATVVFDSNYNSKAPISILMNTKDTYIVFLIDSSIDKSAIVPDNRVISATNGELTFGDIINDDTVLDNSKFTFGDYFTVRVQNMSKIKVGSTSKDERSNAVSIQSNENIQNNSRHTRVDASAENTQIDMMYNVMVNAMKAYVNTFDPNNEGLITFDNGDGGNGVNVSRRRNKAGTDVPFIYSASVGSHHDGSTVGGSIVTLMTNGKIVPFAQFDGHNEKPINIGSDGKLSQDFVDWYKKNTGIRALKEPEQVGEGKNDNTEAFDYMEKMFDVK